ncbi:DNA ligase 1 isoform X1 [Halyomorpha halys]|uniref:DNA ligase 1 isoform X1 n=1 Tax=Halyomorpha halys TaxID=286706 RepID=UPI0006D4F77E|nr:uncharacterized protein LOC106691735 isoform X1 [Halyomorpha halys]
MDQFDDIKMSDSDDDEGAGERVRMIMEEIYKNQDKIKSEKDIEEMAERCTSMMTQMRNEAYIKKKEKKGQRSSGAGDKASPPPSRISSVKESPRKDSTKAAGNPLFPPPGKSALKSPMEYKKKTQKTPNFSELYKEKMEKMRVPGKIDLKGSQTKTDSTKPSEAMREEPKLWGMTKKSSTTLNEAHFRDALNRMKESGMSVKGNEGESSVDRIIKTIAEGDSSDETLSDYNSSKDTDYSGSEMDEKEKLLAEKLLKDLQKKKEQPLMKSRDISELRPYLDRLEKEKKSLKHEGYTTKDGSTQKKKKEYVFPQDLDILSSESEPSNASADTSEVETDPDDPFSQTAEGKDIMKKMKKIKAGPSVQEMEMKKKMKDVMKKGSMGFRPSLDGIDVNVMKRTPPIEWCTLTQAQAESRNNKEWIGSEVKDIESMWFRDICEASERARRSGDVSD